MPFTNTPPSTPILGGANPESCILVTHEVEVTHEVGVAHEGKVSYEVDVTHGAEQKYERATLDIDELFLIPPTNNWKLYYVAADEIEPTDSGWGKIASTTGAYKLGKRFDNLYEVAVDESYIPWLFHHKIQFFDKAKFELQFFYDPTQPTTTEWEVYGWGGLYFRFLGNAFQAIWSGRSQGLELCLRSIAPTDLCTAIEWAILSRDIVMSTPLVRKKFTLCLVLLGLFLLEDYNAPSAIRLLEKDQDEVLQAFPKCPIDLLKAAERRDHKADPQSIGLVRRVFMIAGGLEDVHQLKFDQEYTAIDNLNLLGSHIDVTTSNRLRNFDLQTSLNALCRSKAITNEDMNTLDITELIGRLMALLPIGFQSNLGCSTEVPPKLPPRPGYHAPSTVCLLRVPLLGDGVYEVKKGFGDRKPRNWEVVELRLGGIVTGSTSQTLTGDVNMRLPSSLEEDRLMTLFVDYNGWYKDHQEKRQRLSNEVLRVVQKMEVGQKVLITEEKEDRSLEEEKGEKGKETRIWVVQMLRVQRMRNELEEPQVEYSACGILRLFSSICCEIRGKPSNRGYVAL